MNKLANIFAFLSALMGGLLFIRKRAPAGWALWIPRIIAGALSPVWVVLGAVGGLLGVLYHTPLAVAAGIFGAAASVRYILRTAASHKQFEQVFGPGWDQSIPAARRAAMLKRRWSPVMPEAPEPRFQANLPFWTLPAKNAPSAPPAAGQQGRQLLCDIWQPPEGIHSSGLAFIFFHGSAWYMLDKDVGTRPFFRHLAAQGHVIMDVAYRLFPETDILGMLGDVQRAITWMKANASGYQVDPDRIVVGGGSAGGQLSLLAAYGLSHPELVPEELKEDDLSVRAVISEYGPADLIACYYHTNQDKTTRSLPRSGTAAASNKLPSRLMKAMLGSSYERLGLSKGMEAGAFIQLIGCHPDECPDCYTLLSPIHYVHPGCPPTLLIQGEDDLVTPVETTRDLHRKLQEVGVPVVNLIFPQTEHAFDMLLPRVSPPFQAALYDIERFLALMV